MKQKTFQRAQVIWLIVAWVALGFVLSPLDAWRYIVAAVLISSITWTALHGRDVAPRR